MTNLFGDQDASEVADDPFYVAPDTYLCVSTEAAIVDTKAGGKGLAIKWTIEDEDSEYVGNTISDWHNIYWAEFIEEHEVKPEQVKRSRANMKKNLLAMGVDEDDMNSIHENLDDLVGISAYVTTKESKDKNDPDKVYVNITKIERVD